MICIMKKSFRLKLSFANNIYYRYAIMATLVKYGFLYLYTYYKKSRLDPLKIISKL